MSFPNIVTVIGNIVSLCRATGSDEPYYYYGHPKEIVGILAKKDMNNAWKLKKYPAVFLIHDFKEIRTKYDSEADIGIVFVTETRPRYETSERYTNVFDPVLTPLYETFIEAIRKSSECSWSGEHEVKIYPFWGSEADKNIGNDFADAIELRLKGFKTFYSC